MPNDNFYFLIIIKSYIKPNCKKSRIKIVNYF